MVPIPPGKIATSISVKLGGVAYFYYQPVFADDASEKTISGGWLAIVRGKNIDAQMIMNAAAEMASTGVNRSFFRKPLKLPLSEKEEFFPARNFQIEKDGMSLQCPVPQNFAAHLVGEGGFYPENLEKVVQGFPFLKVKIKKAFLEHSLKQYYPFIRLLETLLLLAGALIALRLYFFGLELKTRLASKAIIGIIIAAALPFGLLIISFFTYIDVAEKAEIIEINNLLKQKVETISSQVINFTDKFHRQAYLLSRALEASAGESEYFRQDLIKNRLIEMHAQEAFLDSIGKKTIQIANPSLPLRPIGKEEFTLGQIISRSFLDSLTSIELYNEETILEQENLFRDVYFVDSNFINNALNSKGRLLEIDQIKSLNSFSLNPVFHKDTTSVAGFLTVKFNQLELINRFLRDFKTDQNKSEVKISIYSFRTAEKKDVIKAHIGILDEKIREKISQAREVGSHIFWRSGSQENAHCLFVLPKFPLIIMAEKKLNGRQNPFWSIFTSRCYMLLLIIFCYHFFAQELLQPIEKLSEAAITAGQGDFKTRTDFYAEGEFLILKNAFNEMVTGMAQKEKLSQFVSREVLESLDENISTGKKIEATVIFAAIKGFSSWIREGHQHEIVNALNLAISTTDRLAEKHGGNLDKVIGNTLMIVFRSRNELQDGNDDHAARACRMALELQQSLGLHNIVMQSGIASGKVISGSVGDANGKIDLTVIGDTVNLAARLKGFAQEAETAMIITAPSTIRALKGLARLKFIKKAAVKGKSREFPIYQLLELRV